MAAKLAQAARAAGRSIPRDLSIVSTQDLAWPASFSGVCIDFKALGRSAASLLEFPKHPARQVRLPTQWAEGETVAPYRGRFS